MEWSNELTSEFLQLFESFIWKAQMTFSKSGAGRDEVYKPTWFAYDTMVDFLQPVYSPRVTISTEAPNEEAVDQQHLGQITTPPPAPSPSLQPQKSKAKRFKSSTQMPPEAIEGHLNRAAIEGRKYHAKMTNNKPGRDDCSRYGELLAPRLRAMDEPNREILMHAIDDLVFQTTMKIKRGVSPSTISSQSSNSNFQPSEWQAHDSQYQPSSVGLNHSQQSHQSMPIRQSLSQMSFFVIYMDRSY
ncbi:uncharacterized protein LOC126740192 [Anthonomus grandis grandis]|uniref:uncharacterized protein LOC126740192 n=1 Tax=Anthonomus grandis grandis TaxID=2921223 RepID=UPI00216612F8|nr:uncharacterized protein LOC126740192 [Anthonomus grandis grandis]